MSNPFESEDGWEYEMSDELLRQYQQRKHDLYPFLRALYDIRIKAKILLLYYERK